LASTLEKIREFYFWKLIHYFFQTSQRSKTPLKSFKTRCRINLTQMMTWATIWWHSIRARKTKFQNLVGRSAADRRPKSFFHFHFHFHHFIFRLDWITNNGYKPLNDDRSNKMMTWATKWWHRQRFVFIESLTSRTFDILVVGKVIDGRFPIKWSCHQKWWHRQRPQ
jgi:hypothetical protein